MLFLLKAEQHEFFDPEFSSQNEVFSELSDFDSSLTQDSSMFDLNELPTLSVELEESYWDDGEKEEESTYEEDEAFFEDDFPEDIEPFNDLVTNFRHSDSLSKFWDLTNNIVGVFKYNFPPLVASALTNHVDQMFWDRKRYLFFLFNNDQILLRHFLNLDSTNNSKLSFFPLTELSHITTLNLNQDNNITILIPPKLRNINLSSDFTSLSLLKKINEQLLFSPFSKLILNFFSNTGITSIIKKPKFLKSNILNISHRRKNIIRRPPRKRRKIINIVKGIFVPREREEKLYAKNKFPRKQAIKHSNWLHQYIQRTLKKVSKFEQKKELTKTQIINVRDWISFKNIFFTLPIITSPDSQINNNKQKEIFQQQLKNSQFPLRFLPRISYQKNLKTIFSKSFNDRFENSCTHM